jgi:G6PDH family F420-dependent oxidoreductase
MRVGTGVTCPIVRIHPAVIAQAVATTSLLFEGRFFFGVGTGEALNEHVVGVRWPPPAVRREMLEEAVAVIRELLTGATVEHRGVHYEVDNARVFDPPETAVPIVVSGFGVEAAELAGRIGDGYWGNAPERDLLTSFERAGGSGPGTRSSTSAGTRVRTRRAGSCSRPGRTRRCPGSCRRIFRRGRTSSRRRRS